MKKLFPGDTKAQRRKKLKFILMATFLGIIVGIITIFITWIESFKR